MTIEERLKDLILSKYHSVREFSLTIDMPNSTLESIFKRGIGNSSVTNIIKICKELGISVDALADGEIVFLKKRPSNSSDSKTDIEVIVEDLKHILNTRGGLTVAGKPITVGGVDSLIDAMDIGVEMAKKKSESLTKSENKV